MKNKRAKTESKVPVSERALIARINRKLAHEGEQLRKKRSPWAAWGAADWGFYAVDVNRNVITADHVDLESWGKELGALEPYERLVED